MPSLSHKSILDCKNLNNVAAHQYSIDYPSPSIITTTFEKNFYISIEGEFNIFLVGNKSCLPNPREAYINKTYRIRKHILQHLRGFLHPKNSVWDNKLFCLGYLLNLCLLYHFVNILFGFCLLHNTRALFVLSPTHQTPFLRC